jgi:hypothetical protein
MKARQVRESIEIPREVIDSMIRNFGRLLKDFEKISEQETMKKVDKRLKDVKERKIKGYSEEDFFKFLKRKGIDVS